MNNFQTAYQVRNISPGGTVWAVPENTRYPVTVVQGFSPGEANQVFGPTLYTVGGRSALVPAPATTIIPGYTAGAPVWGRTMQRAPVMTISQAQAEAQAQIQAQLQAEAQAQAQAQAETQAIQYEQIRAQTLASLGVTKKKGEQRHTAMENYIINSFDKFPGTLQDKINQAVNARNKLDYFRSIGVGVGTKGDLSGRMVKPTDVEWNIWEAYDQGGPQAAETVRKTILSEHKTKRTGVNASVFRTAKTAVPKVASRTISAPRSRSKSPVSNTRGAGTLRVLGPVNKPAGKPVATKARSRSPKPDFTKMTAREIAAYHRKQNKEEKKAKEKQVNEFYESYYGSQ